jgi:hypothetical protein
MDTPMTPDEEYAFYAQPENQEPQGPLVYRSPRASVGDSMQSAT